jgi:Trk K+ transport system NAD-binding subunit
MSCKTNIGKETIILKKMKIPEIIKKATNTKAMTIFKKVNLKVMKFQDSVQIETVAIKILIRRKIHLISSTKI